MYSEECDLSTLVVCVLLGIVLVIVSLNDFLFYRIEDETIWALLGLYALSCVLGVSGHNFLNGLYIAVGSFIITLIMNRFDLIGGGDVKLIFPLLLFAESSFDAFLWGVSVGGVLLSLIYILSGRIVSDFRKKIVKKLLKIRRNHKKNPFLNLVLLSLSRIDHGSAVLMYNSKSVWRQEIPYGVALSCGAFCVIFEIVLSR